MALLSRAFGSIPAAGYPRIGKRDAAGGQPNWGEVRIWRCRGPVAGELSTYNREPAQAPAGQWSRHGLSESGPISRLSCGKLERPGHESKSLGSTSTARLRPPVPSSNPAVQTGKFEGGRPQPRSPDSATLFGRAGKRPLGEQVRLQKRHGCIIEARPRLRKTKGAHPSNYQRSDFVRVGTGTPSCRTVYFKGGQRGKIRRALGGRPSDFPPGEQAGLLARHRPSSGVRTGGTRCWTACWRRKGGHPAQPRLSNGCSF